ncbi:MAG: hypothetical protein SGI87_07685 [Flavobacteriales bacterium]|nr:hypothetical protein [Flavobacteriales bacterium]
MKFIKVIFLLSLIISISSCKKDENDEVKSNIDYAKGVFILNEGSFGNLNASISHIGFNDQLSADPYYNSNGVFLGDVLQGFAVHAERGYAVLNNSQKIEVIDMTDFKNNTTITGFDYPRHIVVHDNYAFVSNGSFAGDVKVIDISTNEIVESIPVGNGPENMLVYNNKLYVCNSGGWTTDNRITVIDILTLQAVSTIEVGDRPMEIALDANEMIWVLSSGETLYDENWEVSGHTDASMHLIDPATDLLVDEFPIGLSGDHPRSFCIGNNMSTLLVVNNNLLSMGIDDLSSGWQTLSSGAYNTVDIDQIAGDIWLTSQPDFVSNSQVWRMNENGTILDTYTGGIGSNGVVVVH